MTARWSWVGPREPRAGGAGEAVSSASVFRDAVRDAIRDLLVVAAAIAALCVYLGTVEVGARVRDGWEQLRQDFAVIQTPDGARVVAEETP